MSEAERRVPLRPAACAVLAALSDGPRPGIDILDAVNATVPRRPLLGPGTLYRLLRELRHDRLIARTTRGVDAADERRVHHVLTPLGRSVLDLELARLQRTMLLVRGARPTAGR